MTGSLDNPQTSRYGNPVRSPPVHLFTNPLVLGFTGALQEPSRAPSRKSRVAVGSGGGGGTRGRRRRTPSAECASVHGSLRRPSFRLPPGSCSVNVCHSSFDHWDDAAIIPRAKISTFNILVKFFLMCFRAHLRFHETRHFIQVSTAHLSQCCVASIFLCLDFAKAGFLVAA